MGTPHNLQLPDLFRLEACGQVGSTMDEARRMASEHAASGVLVWAESQTGGRGRQGRPWHSKPGNLYLSLVLEPDRPLATLAQLGFLTSLVVAETVTHFAPNAPVQVKWPNDVLVNTAKISGILLESTGRARGQIIIGNGLNVSHSPDIPDYPTTCLSDIAGRHLSTAEVLAVWASHFDSLYRLWLRHGFAPLREIWLEKAYKRGKKIRVALPSGDVEGTFISVDAEGQLILDCAGKGLQVIASGEVFFGPEA